MYNLKSYDLLGRVKTVMTRTFKPRDDYKGLKISSDKMNLEFCEDEEYIFNADGNMMESCRCDAQGKMVMLHLFSHNDKGDLIQDFVYSQDGLIARTVHIYDNKGLNVAVVNYLAENIMMDVNISVFNAKGEFYSTESYNEQGILVGKVDYDLNEYGTDVGLTHFHRDIIIYKDRSKVNANQVEIERYSEGNNVFLYTSFIRFDDNHNELKRVYHNLKDAVKELYEYKYEFDNYQNWIKKHEFKNGLLYRVHSREIEYFDQ